MTADIHNAIRKLLVPSLLMLILSIIFFALTQSFFVLCIPVVFLYTLLAIANWKYAYWVLIFCIPLSVQFSLLNNALSLSLPDEPICWLFVFIFILLVANDPKIIPRWWWNDPILLIIIFQLLWLLVSVAHSTVFLLSVKFLLAKIWYLVCFFIFPIFIFREKVDFKKAFLLFLGPLLATVAVIVYRQVELDFTFAGIGVAVGSLYINHVEYATVLSVFSPLMWMAYPLTKNKKRWIRTSLLLLVLLFIPVIFFSYARVAILAIVFAAITGLAIRMKLVNFMMPVIYTAVTVTVIFLIKDNRYIDLHPDYEHTVMHKDYSSHLSSTLQGKDVSSMERLHRWVAAIRMSNDRPLTGYGPHAFVYNYKPYTVTFFKTFVSNNREQSTTHNYFLYMLAEQGWPAMLLYALLIPAVFAHAQTTYHRFNDRFYKYCTLGLAMAFAASFVNNCFSDLIESHKAGAMFYLIISLLMILGQKSKEVVA